MGIGSRKMGRGSGNLAGGSGIVAAEVWTWAGALEIRAAKALARAPGTWTGLRECAPRRRTPGVRHILRGRPDAALGCTPACGHSRGVSHLRHKSGLPDTREIDDVSRPRIASGDRPPPRDDCVHRQARAPCSSDSSGVAPLAQVTRVETDAGARQHRSHFRLFPTRGFGFHVESANVSTGWENLGAAAV